jgi:hypothetical protein
MSEIRLQRTIDEWHEKGVSQWLSMLIYANAKNVLLKKQ